MAVVLAWVAVCAVVGAGGFVAGRATLAPPPDQDDRQPSGTYTVETAVVGRSTTFRAAVSWPTRTVAYASGTGTVTSVGVEPGATAESGTVLFHVDQRPVVLAPGAVPAFRDLREGDAGEDVVQLQEFLRRAGFLAAAADGEFGDRTTRAVRAWQRTLGLATSGDVLVSDLVFAPALPARVVLGPDVVVGNRLAEASPTVEVVLSEPRVTISPDRSSAVPAAGTPVVVRYREHEWTGVVGPELEAADEQAQTSLALVDDAGGPVCGQDCGSLPLHPEPGSLSAQVEIVPSASGPAVPVAALGQDPAGGYVVQDLGGDALPVTVLVTDGSRAIVDGLEPGQEILVLPGGPAAPDAVPGAS